MNVRIASPITIGRGSSRAGSWRGARSRRISFIAIRLSHEPLDVGEHGLARQRDVEHRARERAARRPEAGAPSGKTFSSHQRATSGNESSRSVSPVGAQSTIDRVPLAGLVVALELEQREQLVHAGRDRQLLGGDAVHAALGEQLAEPLRTRVPVALHLLLGLDLLAPEAVRRPPWARRRARPRASRTRQCAGSVESTSVRRPPRRSGARWRRRRTSCRRRPCPCRGSSAASSRRDSRCLPAPGAPPRAGPGADIP